MGSIVDAAQAGDFFLVKSFLDQGANINAVNSAGDAALHWAAWTGNEKIVNLLIEKGANVNQKGGSGKTALELAREAKHANVVTILQAALNLPEPVPAKAVEAWEKMGESTVAHVGTYPALGKKITSVFNFASRDRTLISESLKTGTQGVGPSTSFDDLPREVVKEALGQFEKLGGAADTDYVMNGVSSLDKPKTRLRQL